MFGGISSVPGWFYIVGFTVIILIVIFTEWKTR